MANFKVAWKAFWSILKSEESARDWESLMSKKCLPAGEAVGAEDAAPDSEESAPAQQVLLEGEAVHTLALLQREARLIDFLQEDLTPYSNEQVGAAARKVHDDAKSALKKYFNLEPVLSGEENTQVKLEAGFDTSKIRVSGRLAGEPPFQGMLLHRGWKAGKITLPTRTDAVDPAVICPAEVEIQG